MADKEEKAAAAEAEANKIVKLVKGGFKNTKTFFTSHGKEIGITAVVAVAAAAGIEVYNKKKDEKDEKEGK